MREIADLFYWSALKTHIEWVWRSETDPFSSCVRQGHDFTRSFSTLPAHGMEIPLEMKPALTHNSKFCLGVGLWFPNQKYWPIGQHMKYRLCGCDGSSSHLACDYHCRQTYLNWWKHSRAYRWTSVSVWLVEHPNPESALLGKELWFLRKTPFLVGSVHSLLGFCLLGWWPCTLQTVSPPCWEQAASGHQGCQCCMALSPHCWSHPTRSSSSIPTGWPSWGGFTRECTQPHSPAYLNNHALCCGFFRLIKMRIKYKLPFRRGFLLSVTSPL